ncbi:hypothetical protein NSK_006271 [Nannochloropsis salina CCMP1776]|uniref:Uncharacterized protein n=1 Tax=Nannochloropsis salina CCMP1776 TaxID=1027361 RepID=A0A4D9CYH3_9STRA|nr:hypothetical protein NSK_006271 [Nannochloropsis salina CCMP1776]|eukprot:TFJ82445.1 hypothetical protein NSK_006271 [Nannochloropsis salina CCMP1776]
MKDFSCAFLVALLGFGSILTTISKECPRLSLTANVRPNPRRGIVAGTGKAKITVILKSNDPVDNVEFQLNLPDGLSVERTAMRPSSKPNTPPQIVEDADGVTAISWQGLAFTKRKGGKRRFRVKVKADQCAPETLVVDAFAYLMNATDTSCMTPLANPAIVKVRYLKRNKDATCAPTPAPTVNPTQPFVLLGEGLRFSQGERLAPFEDRRRSLHTGINRHEDIIARYHPEDRQLQSIDTPEACYEYCSLNAGEEVPFLFSWNTVTSQCFCCAGVDSNGSPNADTYSIAYSRTDSYPYSSTLNDSNGSPNADTYSIAYSRTHSCPYSSTLNDSNGSPNADTYSIAYSSTHSYSYPSTFDDSNGFPNDRLQSTATLPGIVVKVNLTDFSRVDSLALENGEDELVTSVVSGEYAYFGTENFPGIVVKVNLTDFSRVDSLELDNGEDSPRTSVVSGEYAYFGTDTSPGIVVKVNLTDFSRVDSLELDNGENILQTSVVSGEYAYFGTETSPGIVVKVNLTDFSRVDSLELDNGENNLYTSVVSGEYAYFGILTTISKECPQLSLTANVRPNPRRGIVAGTGKAKITVILKSNDPVDNVEFQLNLPDGLSVERTAMRPSSKPNTPPQIVEDADGVTAISWQGLAFTKRKGGKRRFRVKVKADQCAPETLVVDAFAYLMNATDTSCMTPLANPAIVKVRYLKRNKDATCAPTPAPTVNPTQPFVLLGEGLRFSQGERLAPFEDRRRSLHTRINRHEDIFARYNPEDRQLQSIDTPEACYEHCSLNAGEEVPFLFSWNTVTSQCFCCAGVCTPLIVDPDYNVYEALLPRTLPPTPIPTTAAPPTTPPTPTPTASPTPGPTRTPTQAPSTTPTAPPTPTPTASPTPGPTRTPTQAPSTTPTAPPTPSPTSTWTEQTAAGSRDWASIASSLDGTNLAAVVNGGSIYTSTDAGVSWTEQADTDSRSWSSIASSSDGMNLAAVVNGGSIYTSTDAGVSWTEQTNAGSRGWRSIASSSNGTKASSSSPIL